MYQKLSPAQSTSQLKGQVTSTLPSCADSKVTDLRGTSQYRNYITFETICSKYGKHKYGLIDYVSTDTHDMPGREPLMAQCYDVLVKDYGKETAMALTHDNAQELFE